MGWGGGVGEGGKTSHLTSYYVNTLRILTRVVKLKDINLRL